MEHSVEPMLSKYLHEKGQKKGLPIAGTFELTARCNFNCKMCYVHLTETEQRRRGRELTAEEWLEIAQKARDAGMLFLLLTGGEPTLRADFPDIYRALQKMGFMISVNTNGYLLQDEILELFTEVVPTRVNVSLYGVSNETYLRMCGVPAYDRIVKNIEALRKAGVNVKLNLSLTPDNMDDMEAVLRQAKALGASIQVSPYMFPPVRREKSMVGQNYRMSAEQAGELQAKYNLLSMTEEQFCLLASQMAKGVAKTGGDACEGVPGKAVMCRAGSSSFWLMWDGKMTPCGQMAEPAYHVPTMGFDAAWQAVREATAAIRLPRECSNCDLNFLCHACAAMCYCETGEFNKKPEYLCSLNRSYLKTTQKLWQTVYGGRLP